MYEALIGFDADKSLTQLALYKENNGNLKTKTKQKRNWLDAWSLLFELWVKHPKTTASKRQSFHTVSTLRSLVPRNTSSFQLTHMSHMTDI